MVITLARKYEGKELITPPAITIIIIIIIAITIIAIITTFTLLLRGEPLI